MKRSIWCSGNHPLLTALLLGIGVFCSLSQHGIWMDFAVAQQSATTSSTSEEDAPVLSLDEVLARLQSPEEKLRQRAIKSLLNIGAPSSQADGIRLLRAAATGYPDTSAQLIQIAGQRFYPAYLPVIQEVFPRLSDKGKLYALRTLVDRAVDYRERAAISTFIAIFQSHAKAGRIPELEDWVMMPLRHKPVFADVLYPRLLSYTDQSKLSITIFYTTLLYCDAGVLKQKTLTPYSGHLLKTYEPLRHWLVTKQRPTGHEWMWTEEYQQKRDDAAILLDVMAHFVTPSVAKALQQALMFRDPRLKHFAVISLLRQGKKVATKEIEAVAASDEMRGWLYYHLHAFGMLSLFPRRYASQKALAQSDMVQWLAFPTELGKVPDEIQLMKVVPISRGKGKAPVDYYVFRFRVKGDSEGWLAGIAGPYPRGKSLTPSGADTFSSFEKWSERTPEGHVQARISEEEDE